MKALSLCRSSPIGCSASVIRLGRRSSSLGTGLWTATRRANAGGSPDRLHSLLTGKRRPGEGVPKGGWASKVGSGGVTNPQNTSAMRTSIGYVKLVSCQNSLGSVIRPVIAEAAAVAGDAR